MQVLHRTSSGRDRISTQTEALCAANFVVLLAAVRELCGHHDSCHWIAALGNGTVPLLTRVGKSKHAPHTLYTNGALWRSLDTWKASGSLLDK